MTTTIGIFLFDEVEVLDFAGPFEVFCTASRVKHKLAPEQPPLFEVFTVAEEPRLVRARGGLAVSPGFNFSNHPSIEVLVVPGGVVTEELAKPAVSNWIKQVAAGGQLTASVCTGAFLLAQAGVLVDQTVTTHWEDIDDLRRVFPNLTVKENIRWVDDGNFVTSAGISAGIDMSLHLVARLAGEELARKTARQMEYDWNMG